MWDIFVRRPVLAVVVSLLIFLVGARSLALLQVRQYPVMENTVISVTTTFPGADAELMQGFITQPIEKAVASADGIDYLTSASSYGQSVVNVYVRLNYDPDAAMTSVTAKVNQVRALLPRGINDPVIVKSTGQSFAAIYLAFTSDVLTQEQITEYVSRVIQPKLAVVPGVASPDILGGRTFAMRVWLDPDKLAQYGVTTGQVVAALNANNYQAAAGSTKGYFDVITTTALTDARSAEEFRKLVVKSSGTELVRIGDLGTVSLGAESEDSSVLVNGEPAVFVGVQTSPDANPISVVGKIRELLPEIERDLPTGLKVQVAYDSTIFITASIEEVLKTVGEAALIVIVVIFLFLGSIRSVVIPIVTIPLSLVGVGIAMAAMGFSINLLTLLAMVLAIGLVVDDAIVVVENTHRHIEEGLSPFQAAVKGIREIANPVISMTITLAAVYSPIALTGGLTGALFREFALTLAGAVIVSGIVALTLSPMMCSRLLKHTAEPRGFQALIDRVFGRIQRGYTHMLSGSLDDRPTTIVFAFIVFGMLGVLFPAIQQELAPEEDQGVLFIFYNGPSQANIDYMNIFSRDLGQMVRDVPQTLSAFAVNGFSSQASTGFGAAILKPWSERDKTAKQLQQVYQTGVNGISGIKGSVFSPPALPVSGSGLPVSFVITTTGDYRQLVQASDRILHAAQTSGRFLFVDTDLKFNSPQTVVDIDRDKAAAYGITMASIGETLAAMTGGNYVNLINLEGRSYQVIPQTPRRFRLDPDQLGRFYVRSHQDTMIPLSSLITIEDQVTPLTLNRFNQLNSATISGVPMIGLTLGDALDYLRQQAAETLPTGYSIDYSGNSRQYVQEGSALYLTFIFALVIIYLVLAAQYESLRDPLVILVSVPLSVVGALIPLALGVSSMNIYSQIGLVTLIGLISKHGILICEVAREQQEQHGLSRKEAVLVAAELRLRPVLMTTAAMVAGLIPLLYAAGAGAASRFSIAVVIVAGMSIGTLFTLFVLPVIYTFLATDRTRTRERLAAEEKALAALEGGAAPSR